MPDVGNALARSQLEKLTEQHRAEPRIGCSLVAHRDLGFCGFCPRLTPLDEANAWQLLAMAERGIPRQPAKETG